MRRASLLIALLAATLVGAAARPAAAVPIRIVYRDAPGTGFDDPQLGAARRTALEYAVNLWSSWLAGDVEVVLWTWMVPRGGDERSALLASTGPWSLHRDFPGSGSIWYGAALANVLAGIDLNGPQEPEITAIFNSSVDDEVLGDVDWYYGLDAQPGRDIDFVTIALHELGHGLNFFDLINPATGAPLLDGNDTGAGAPSLGIFERFLTRPGVDRFINMKDSERLAAITSGHVVWDGSHVLAAYRAPVPIYAPAPFQSGSSLSHWDIAQSPDELLEPFYTGPSHDPGLLLPALADMGWTVTVATPTPRSSAPIAASPTFTPTPTATPTPRSTRRRALAFVSNFDSQTVSVIDPFAHTGVATLRVGAGPLGLAASHDGRRVYVAEFHAGGLAIIDAQRRRVAARLPVGATAHSVAVSPDGRRAYVSDTFDGLLHVVDLDAIAVIDSFPVGTQPGAVVVTPDGGRVLVANYGGTAVMVDPALRAVVAIFPILSAARFGPLALALAPNARQGFVTLESGYLSDLDLRSLQLRPALEELPYVGVPEAAAFTPDSRAVYVASHGTWGGRALRIEDGVIAQNIVVGDVPEAVASRSDGAEVFVANGGSNTISVIDTAAGRVTDTLPVGAAPMGMVMVDVPAIACAGDCRDRGVVDVADLMLAVSIALGDQPVNACANIDADADGQVTVDEVLAATASALRGCAGS